MGAYSPSLLITNDMQEKINKKIIEPTIKSLNDIGCSFVGILYAGLMLTNNEPKLIEYNIRFGDPECQVIMMRLENDLLDLIIGKKQKFKRSKNILEKRTLHYSGGFSKGLPGKISNYDSY